MKTNNKPPRYITSHAQAKARTAQNEAREQFYQRLATAIAQQHKNGQTIRRVEA